MNSIDSEFFDKEGLGHYQITLGNGYRLHGDLVYNLFDAVINIGGGIQSKTPKNVFESIDEIKRWAIEGDRFFVTNRPLVREGDEPYSQCWGSLNNADHMLNDRVRLSVFMDCYITVPYEAIESAQKISDNV